MRSNTEIFNIIKEKIIKSDQFFLWTYDKKEDIGNFDMSDNLTAVELATISIAIQRQLEAGFRKKGVIL